MNVYYLNIAGIQDMDPLRWKALISPERYERAKLFCKSQDRVRCICAELLLRYGLDQNGIPTSDLHFYYNPYGKPLLDLTPKVYFNISHSGDYVVCAISKENVGVDIEACTNDHLLLTEEVLTDAELHCYHKMTEHEKKRYFCKLWTIKESVVKYIGTGLQTPLCSVETCISGNRVSANVSDKVSLYLHVSSIGAEYYSSICTLNDRNYDIASITPLKLFSFFSDRIQN